MLDNFRQAIEAAGLTAPETIIADGDLHRFASNGDRADDAGWYVLHGDGFPAGSFGCFRSNLTQKWCAKSEQKLTERERAEYRTRIAAMQRQRDTEERQRHAAAAHRAQSIWDAARPAPEDHPYLQRKGVQAHGLRVGADVRLIVPIYKDGVRSSLEFIDKNSDKKFLFGGAKKGGSYTLGELTPTSTIVICEGFATAASLFEATDYPTLCAFSAGNLLPVAQGVRQQFPSAVIVLAGDNDQSGVGQKAAREAAAAVGGMVVIPDDVGMDWNDVAVTQGLEMVRTQMETMLHEREAQVDAVPNPSPRRADGDQGLVKELADAILATHHFAQDAGGQLYVYASGAYRPQGDAQIAQQVKAILLANEDTKRWSSHRAREVTEFIRVDAPTLWERPPSTVMNLTNGLLDVTTGTLAPHSTGHLSPVQLPVAFDPSATCPLWESFTARVLPADCHALPFEIIASAMRGDVSDQKAALAVGPGDNGKSTFLDAVICFLGLENVSTLALQRLEADKFAVVRLLGKLANVCADLPSDHLAGTSTFKALTGGDRLTAERKFQGSFEFTPFTRLLFSTNHYPASKDASHAFFRRWLVIPFDAVLDPREKIHNLVVQLTTPGELSGVLNRALAALPGMIHRGGFTQSESTQASLMEFREMTDPLAAWLDRFTVLSPDGMVSRKDLGISYNAASEAASRPLMTAKAFCAAVRRLRPTIPEAQRSVCGQVQWVFQGLALASSTASASRHSHHSTLFSQISLEGKQEREDMQNEFKKGNGVNDVNAVNENLVAEEVVNDDN